ncbi:MAG: ABC transporter substrate-binding protein [Spirochaetaceae bacterium]
MKRLVAAFFALLLTLGPVSLLYAEGVQETPAEITVEDALGRRVELSGVPERIVLAGRATIMLVDALYLFPGVSERVVAVGQTDQGIGDFFPVVDENPEEKARLGRTAGPEEVLAHNPDLVIMKTQMRDSLGSALVSAGATVLYLNLETPEQYNDDIRTLGAVLDQPGRAREIVDHFEERVQALQSATEEASRPELLLLSFSTEEGGYSFSVAPEGWMQARQVTLGGGEPVWFGAALSPGWNQVAFEQIAAWDPEVIVFLAYRSSSEAAIEAIEDDPIWRELRAVRNRRIYAMPADYYSWGQPDTRWILGAEWFAYLLHPELFDRPFELRVLSFFQDFYGIRATEYYEKIAPRLTGDLLD